MAQIKERDGLLMDEAGIQRVLCLIGEILRKNRYIDLNILIVDAELKWVTTTRKQRPWDTEADYGVQHLAQDRV